MIGWDFKRATAAFFDRKTVMSKVDTTTRKVLSKFGSFVRTTARNSIKKAPYRSKKPRGQERTDFTRENAPPGEPPYSQIGLLKKFIFFGFDPRKRSVVIGPVRLSQKGRGEAPSLLEHGGTTTLKRRGKRRTARFKPRPFMGPAFEKEKPQLPTIWRASVRK